MSSKILLAVLFALLINRMAILHDDSIERAKLYPVEVINYD